MLNKKLESASEHFTWKLSNQNQPGLILIDGGCAAG